jgi:GTPase SAR1 family protein
MPCFVPKSKTLKLLLLGAEGSGKTTMVKQMRIHHGENFTVEERKNMKKCLLCNIFQAMRTLIFAMKTLEIPYENSDSIDKANLITSKQCISKENEEKNMKMIMSAIKYLWNDAGVIGCYNRQPDCKIQMDSIKHFLPKLDYLTNSDYMLTNDDIVHIYTPTHEILEYDKETNLRINGSLFQVIDIGGQLSERKKWIHCVENITAVMFLAALSDFDQSHKMEESIAIFHTIVKWFQNSPIILYLTKKDILEEKIIFSDLIDHFPDYNGPKKDLNAAKNFILMKFCDFDNSKRINKKPISTQDLFDLSDNDICLLDLHKKLKQIESPKFKKQYIFSHCISVTNTEKFSSTIENAKESIVYTVVNQNLEYYDMM